MAERRKRNQNAGLRREHLEEQQCSLKIHHRRHSWWSQKGQKFYWCKGLAW